MMFNPFSAITSKVYGALAVFFLGLALIQTARIEGFLFWDGLYEQLGDARDTIAGMKIASENAGKEQLALNQAVQSKQDQIARLTDENETNRLKISSAADAYARRMRWGNHCPAQTNTAPESDPSEGGDRPSEDAVILSRADFDILNANTARLMDIKAWGDKLIGEGLADVYKDHQKR
jgi:hypothetical protein